MNTSQLTPVPPSQWPEAQIPEELEVAQAEFLATLPTVWKPVGPWEVVPPWETAAAQTTTIPVQTDAPTEVAASSANPPAAPFPFATPPAPPPETSGVVANVAPPDEKPKRKGRAKKAKDGETAAEAPKRSTRRTTQTEPTTDGTAVEHSTMVPPIPAPQSAVHPGMACELLTGECYLKADGTPYGYHELIQTWMATADKLAEVKNAESKLRAMVVGSSATPAKVEGTENIDLGAGWILKVVKSLTFKVDDAKIDGILDEIEQMGEVGMRIASTLINMKPSVSRSVYRDLMTSDGVVEPTIAAKLQGIITYDHGSPQVSVIAPKAE